MRRDLQGQTQTEMKAGLRTAVEPATENAIILQLFRQTQRARLSAVMFVSVCIALQVHTESRIEPPDRARQQHAARAGAVWGQDRDITAYTCRR